MKEVDVQSKALQGNKRKWKGSEMEAQQLCLKESKEASLV